MTLTRRNVLGGLFAGGALTATSGCNWLASGIDTFEPENFLAIGMGRPALQLYSLNRWIPAQDADPKIALAKALVRIREIGFEAVEFAGYYGATAPELKKMLADAGLKVCGTHVDNKLYGFGESATGFDADVLKKTCEFELGYGNDLVICPGGGNFPPGCTWSTGRGGEPCTPSQEIDDFSKRLVDLYNRASVVAAQLGCRIGLHNHTWEHTVKLLDGTSFWDFFFTNTDSQVAMEQDVGWSTCAGIDPAEQYVKYPHRSPTLHAKENGMGKDVTEFDAILGRPGKPGATPVDWDKLFLATHSDGVKWYVVECERHFDDIEGAVVPSYEFLKSKGNI